MSSPNSAVVTLDSLSLVTPDGRSLFANLSLSLGRQRVGLVGRNGSGKSTLLLAIAGSVEPAAGSIARTGSIALLHQDWLDSSISIAKALEIAEPLARLRRIESGEGDADDLGEADWTLEERVGHALAEVGLSGLDLDRSPA
jgi:ATPase subunit of ABC transporter with duplicated ATPase domains